MIRVSTTSVRVTGFVIFSLAASFLGTSACTPKDEKKDAPDPFAFLAVGAPSDKIGDTIATADLQNADAVSKLPARISELVKADKEPRAVGVLLRAYAIAKKEDAAKLACDLLDTIPPLVTYDGEPHRALTDAALLAIVHGKMSCKDRVLPRLGKDRCGQYFRCTADGGKLGTGATDQRERLCSTEDLTAEMEKELARPKTEVLADKSAQNTERWALGALRMMDAVPADFVKAHERRQTYALTQVATPECGMGIKIGTPCHTYETAIRDQLCRSDSSPVSFSTMKFEFSDEKKTIFNVVEASPP